MDAPGVILALDPAASTGYCLVSVSDCKSRAVIYSYGFIDVDQSSEFSGDWCLDLQSQLRKIIKKHEVSHIAVENFFFSKRFANGSTVNVELRTAIYMLARELKIPYTILGISEWKKFISGRVTPTPEQKKKWGKERAKKLAIQEALWKKYQIKFPNHSISKKTGKPISPRLDMVDAVGQAIYFCRIYIDVLEIACSVEVPKDQEVKGKPSFQYE